MTPLEALWEIRRGFCRGSHVPADLFDRVEAALTEGDDAAASAEPGGSVRLGRTTGPDSDPGVAASPSVSSANPTTADEYTPVEVLEATINLLPSDDPVIYNDAHDALLEIEAELSVLRVRAAAADTLAKQMSKVLALCRDGHGDDLLTVTAEDALAAYGAAKETT